MKKLNCLFLFLAIVLFISGCRKESSSSGTEIVKQSNVSKVTLRKSASVSEGTNQSAFQLHSAGIYQEMLFMSVSYTGGNLVHEFIVNWDGNINQDGDKKVITLTVSHPEINDTGLKSVFDSVSADISLLGITPEMLNDPLLWVKVVNSTDASNSFLFQTVSTYVDPLTVVHTRNVKVVREDCTGMGLWNDLWLVTTDATDVSYFFVKEIDNSVTYTPSENDLLKIDYNLSWLTDSLNLCPAYLQLKATPIKVLKVTK